MSLENYIRAMPKVDLHVQLEGAIDKALLLMIAEQTDIASTYKRPKQFREWVDLLTEPDFNRIDEIAGETFSWVRHPEDLARAVYEIGVHYSKQNVQYAEISAMPVLHTDLGLTFQQFIDGINDGADRVLRAWKVRINWALSMPRERPRKSDDVAKWATSATAQKGNVVALSLVGREDAQPVAQFKKAFATAEKKDLARITPALSYPDSDSFEGVIDTAHPTRLVDSWGLIENEQALEYVIENGIPVMITPSREVRLGWIDSIAEYPIRQLLERGVNVIVGSGMPALYETTLSDEYIALVEQCGLTIDEIETISLNSIRSSLLPVDEKHAMIDEFQQAYEALREEHLVEEAK